MLPQRYTKVYQKKHKFLNSHLERTDSLTGLGEYSIEDIDEAFSPTAEAPPLARMNTGGGRSKILEYERRLTQLDKKCATLASEPNIVNIDQLKRHTSLLPHSKEQLPSSIPEEVSFDLQEKMKQMNEE